MLVDVLPINRFGRPIPKKERNGRQPCRGTLKVLENLIIDFGKVVRCARLVSVDDGLERDILPEIMDAKLIWLAVTAVRIRGIEKVDGAYFGQIWDIRVPLVSNVGDPHDLTFEPYGLRDYYARSLSPISVVVAQIK